MFSSEIHITIRKDVVRFTKKMATVELRPDVYLDHRNPPRILAVGDPPEGLVAGRVVHLFDGKDDEEDKGPILEAFFRYGIRKVSGSGFSLAPKISFEVAPEIVASLGGYHRLVLHYCAKMAGAVSTPYEKNYGNP